MKAGAHTLKASSDKQFSHGFELLASCGSQKCQISMFAFDFNASTMMQIVIFILLVLHGSVHGCIIKMQWIHCIPLDSEKCHD